MTLSSTRSEMFADENWGSVVGGRGSVSPICIAMPGDLFKFSWENQWHGVSPIFVLRKMQMSQVQMGIWVRMSWVQNFQGSTKRQCLCLIFYTLKHGNEGLFIMPFFALVTTYLISIGDDHFKRNVIGIIMLLHFPIYISTFLVSVLLF